MQMPKVPRYCVLQALADCVTRALFETLSNFTALLLKLHEISCSSTAADGTDGPQPLPFHWLRMAIHAPPAKSTSQNATRSRPAVSARTLHRAQKRPSQQGPVIAVSLAEPFYLAKLMCYRAGGEDVAYTKSIHPILRTNNKCISLPCSRIVVPTLHLRRYLVQDLCCSVWVSTCHIDQRQISFKLHTGLRCADLVKARPIDFDNYPCSTVVLYPDANALRLQVPGGRAGSTVVSKDQGASHV
jgi:hypothetical protein